MKLVSVETPEKSVCKMTFSASAEELEAASNAVYERTRATYTIKGFAKGEADRAQIEADRGEHTFWYDAINDLMDRDVPALYEAAMAEHGFKAVDEPSYDLVSVKKDDGFVATATTPLQPELNLTQTTGFHVECVTPAVTDKEIDAVLERRRNAAAELVPHKGPAVKGNVVHMDFEGLLDGVAFQGGTAQNQSVQLGSGRMIPGFEDGILGHKAGDEFDIHVTFPERYHAKDLAGKAVVFKVKVHEVKEKEVPAMDDEFAKDVSEFDTLKDLKADLKKKITEERQKDADRVFEENLMNQVAENITADIPDVMVENQAHQYLDNFKAQISRQFPYEEYKKMTGMDDAKLLEEAKEPALRQVKMDLATAAIIKAENIEASDEDVEAEFAKMAEQFGMDVEMVKKYLSKEQVHDQILTQKAVAVVVDSATAEKPAKKTAKKAAEGEEEKKPAAKKTTKKAAEGEEEKKPAKKTAKKAAEKAE